VRANPLRWEGCSRLYDGRMAWKKTITNDYAVFTCFYNCRFEAINQVDGHSRIFERLAAIATAIFRMAIKAIPICRPRLSAMTPIAGGPISAPL
jgi:hypothetical protein